jgi:hypothetical protein
MFKSFKRLGAAIVIAMLIVPHFALAGSATPTNATCLDDGPDANDVAETSCGNFTPTLVYDQNSDTGNHIDGPDYPILITVDFGTSLSVTGLTIMHHADGTPNNRVAPTATNASNVVQWSTNNSDWYTFGNIPAYDDAADRSAEVTGSATARYLRVWNWENVNPGAGWQPSEFTAVTAAAGGAAPEMGVWALLVILPIMGYVVYKTAPDIKLTRA